MIQPFFARQNQLRSIFCEFSGVSTDTIRHHLNEWCRRAELVSYAVRTVLRVLGTHQRQIIEQIEDNCKVQTKRSPFTELFDKDLNGVTDLLNVSVIQLVWVILQPDLNRAPYYHTSLLKTVSSADSSRSIQWSRSKGGGSQINGKLMLPSKQQQSANFYWLAENK